jgi:hypothetical protein
VRLLLLLLLPAYASAASVAVVGVHGDGRLDDEDLRSLHGDLVVAVEQAGLQPLAGEPLSELLRPARQAVVDAVFLEPVRRSFEEGRVLYEQAQPELARGALERAAEAEAEVAEFVTDPRLSVDVWLYQGLVAFSLGDDAGATEAFSEVVRRDPDRVLDSLDYPPNIVDLFGQVRADVAGGPGADLSVSIAGGAPGRVYLDGRLLGSAPTVATGVPPGEHRLLVEGPSGRWFERLRLTEGAKAVEATLEQRGLAAAEDRGFDGARSSATRRLYRQVGEAAATDLVLVAAVDADGNLGITLWSTHSGTFAQAVAFSLAGAPGKQGKQLQGVVARLAEVLDEGGRIRAEQVAARGISMRLGANPVLNELLFAEPKPVVAPSGTGEPSEPVVERKKPKPGAIAAAVIGGVLGAAGAGVGIYFAARPPPEPPGSLVIRFP